MQLAQADTRATHPGSSQRRAPDKKHKTANTQKRCATEELIIKQKHKAQAPLSLELYIDDHEKVTIPIIKINYKKKKNDLKKMAARFKKAGFFHVQPAFTTQQHTQPGALWCQHPLLPLQDAAFDSWKAGSKQGEMFKENHWL